MYFLFTSFNRHFFLGGGGGLSAQFLPERSSCADVFASWKINETGSQLLVVRASRSDLLSSSL